jgi:enolase-phosphatase E1
MSASAVKHLLVDIEGTTTSISFVHDVLFPFARAHVHAFVREHFDRLRESGLLGELSAVDEQCSVASVDDVCASVARLMDADRKVAPLKALQGQIWSRGYESGELIGHLYDDVVPTLVRLALPTSVFSSGSIAAQKLLFAHTANGSILHMFQQHFDTTTAGSKVEAPSYARIAARVGCGARRDFVCHRQHCGS